MDETARQIGQLDARMSGVESDVKEIKTDVKSLVAAQIAGQAVRNAASGSIRNYLVPFVALGVSVIALLMR